MVAEYYTHNREQAKETAERVLGLAKEQQLIRLQINAHQWLTYLIQLDGDYQSALLHYSSIKSLQEEIIETESGDGGTELSQKEQQSIKADLAHTLNNIGVIYHNQGQIETSLEYYHRSLTLSEELKDTMGISYCLNNIGGIYDGQGHFEKAMENYQRSLALQEEFGDNIGIANALYYVSTLHANAGAYEKGAKGFYRTLYLYNKANDNKAIANSMQALGSTLCELDSVDKGLYYLKEGLKISRQLKDSEWIGIASQLIAHWLYFENELDSAEQYGLLALKIGQELKYPANIRDAAQTLSMTYKKQNRWREALTQYEYFIGMRDSISNEENQKATIRQQTKYEFEKAQLIKEQEAKEVVRLEAEKTARRDNLQYSVVLICLLAIGTLVAMLGRLSLPVRMAEGIIFFSFLILFEFLLVVADPYIENWSGGAPGFKLLFNAGIAALMFPLHAFFELKLKGRLAK